MEGGNLIDLLMFLFCCFDLPFGLSLFYCQYSFADLLFADFFNVSLTISLSLY